MHVTPVTNPETRKDDLTDKDYQDIYQELRRGKSLRQFLELTQSTVSPSFWSQYEAGVKSLTTERKNELRRAVNLTELAPDPAQALSNVTEDVRVWRIGDGNANRIVLVTETVTEPLTVGINGTVYIQDGFTPENTAEVPVTGVTFDPGTGRRQRKPTVGIGGLEPATRARLDAARQAQHMTWNDFLLSLVTQ